MNSLDEGIKSLDILLIEEHEVKTVSLREKQKIDDYLKILAEATFHKKEMDEDRTKGEYQSNEVIVTSYKRGTTVTFNC